MGINRRSFVKNSAASLAGALASGTASTVFSADASSLITKTIPSTGEQLPIVGLGTNSFRSAPSDEEKIPLLEVIKIFSEHGGLIDTAPSYGRSESVLGDLISELGVENKMIFSTKCDKSGGDATRAQIAQSLDFLKTRPIDIMEIHNLRSWQANLPVLREAKQEGSMRYLGITTSRPNQYEELLSIMRSEPMDFIQVNYSILDRGAEAEILPLAAEKGLAVLANVPYGRGNAFSAVKGLEVPEWAKEFCASWGQFFLKYNASHPALTASIPGTTTPRYAFDNVGAAMGRLPTAVERKMQEDFMAGL